MANFITDNILKGLDRAEKWDIAQKASERADRQVALVDKDYALKERKFVFEQEQADNEKRERARKLSQENLARLQEIGRNLMNVDKNAAIEYFNGETFQAALIGAGIGKQEFTNQGEDWEMKSDDKPLNDKILPLIAGSMNISISELNKRIAENNYNIYTLTTETRKNANGEIERKQNFNLGFGHFPEEKPKKPPTDPEQETALAFKAAKYIRNYYDKSKNPITPRELSLIPDIKLSTEDKKLKHEALTIQEIYSRKLSGAVISEKERKHFKKLFGYTIYDNIETYLFKINTMYEVLEQGVPETEKERTSWINTKEKKLNKMSSDNKPTSDFSWITGKGG